MTNQERMLEGKLYLANDPELISLRRNAKRLLEEFNQTSFIDGKRRNFILKQLFKETGKAIYIEPHFHCDYGINISIGESFYANYDCIMIDVCEIKIGNNVFLGPRVIINTATHPIDKDVRNTQLELGKPITIGNDVFIGSGVIINPGLTVGDNVVIGSGSVVTHNLPSNAVYVGNPAKKLRDIDEKDAELWKKEEADYHEEMRKK